MSMRPRYDENGNEYRWHNMIFDDMPDDYIMRQILLNNGCVLCGFHEAIKKI